MTTPSLKMTPFAGRHYALLADGSALMAVKVYGSSHVSGGEDPTVGWALYSMAAKFLTVTDGKLTSFSDPSVVGVKLGRAGSLKALKTLAAAHA